MGGEIYVEMIWWGGQWINGNFGDFGKRVQPWTFFPKVIFFVKEEMV